MPSYIAQVSRQRDRRQIKGIRNAVYEWALNKLNKVNKLMKKSVSESRLANFL
jgi:hypothetical protein